MSSHKKSKHEKQKGRERKQKWRDGKRAKDKLLPHHREYLNKEAGLDDKTIDEQGIFSIDGHRKGRALARKLLKRKEVPFRGPAIVFPVYDRDGKLVGHVLKPDRPRLKNGKPVKYESPLGVGCHLYFLGSEEAKALGYDDISVPLLLTEGIKKMLAVAQVSSSVIPIGGQGVNCWHDTVARKATGKLKLHPDFKCIPLKGRRVYIAFDAPDTTDNANVIQAENTLSRILGDAGARVKLIRIPFKPSGPKVGIDDYLAMFDKNGRKEALKKLRRKARTAVLLPRLEITPDEAKVVDRAEKLISGDRRVFQRCGTIVCIRRDLAVPPFLREPKRAPHIAPVSHPNCREALSRVAEWGRYAKDEKTLVWRQERPPHFVVQDLLARGEYRHIRPLTAVIEVPVLRADGTVLSTPGYDEKTGLLYEPTGPVPEIPRRPTLKDARAAAKVLFEVYRDFPFEAKSHKSALLAALLTPFARYAFNGRVPMLLIEAPAAGTGKTLLADTIGVICTGRELPKMANTTDDAEMRKRLLAIALTGSSIVLLDNVHGGLGTASLSMALTAGEIRERLLGVNEERIVRLTSMFIASGNNVELLGDTRRRVLYVRLDAREERPEERDDFRHPNLLRYVARNRAKYVAAALTILRAYDRADRPVVGKVKPWGSFEPWQRLVCGAVRWLDLAAPEDTRAGLIEAESEPERLAEFFRAWEKAQPEHGMSAAQALALAEKDNELKSALVSACHPRGGGELTTDRLGYFLRRVRDRVIAGLRMEAGVSNGTKKWVVTAIGGDGHAHTTSAAGEEERREQRKHRHHRHHHHQQDGERRKDSDKKPDGTGDSVKSAVTNYLDKRSPR